MLLGVKRESTDINIFEQKFDASPMSFFFLFSLFEKKFATKLILYYAHSLFLTLSLTRIYNNKEERREIIKR